MGVGVVRVLLVRLVAAILAVAVVAAVSGVTLAGAGLVAGAGADAGYAGVGFAALAFAVGLPLSVAHALLVAPIAAWLELRARVIGIVVHLIGGGLLATLVGPQLFPLGAFGGIVFRLLEGRLLRGPR